MRFNYSAISDLRGRILEEQTPLSCVWLLFCERPLQAALPSLPEFTEFVMMWITILKLMAENQVLRLSSAPVFGRVTLQAVPRMSSTMWTSVKFGGESSSFQKMMSLVFAA